MNSMSRIWIASLFVIAVSAGCASHPMILGPPRPLAGDGLRYSGAVSWAKPIDSASVGAPQVEGALHLEVAEGFDLAVRAWTAGAGIQGRLAALTRPDSGVSLLVGPMVGVAAVVGIKPEESEEFLPPIDVEFLAGLPVVLGFGIGQCEAFVGGDPLAHIRPDQFVLRGAAVLGTSCPMKSGSWIAPELSFQAPLFGGANLRPEEGQADATRHPLVASVIRLGISLSF